MSELSPLHSHAACSLTGHSLVAHSAPRPGSRSAAAAGRRGGHLYRIGQILFYRCVHQRAPCLRNASKQPGRDVHRVAMRSLPDIRAEEAEHVNQ